MNLAELIASGRATISVEEASEIWGVGRCTGYEIAESTFGAVRCGRKLRVPVPRLIRAMGVPLPDEWRPGGMLANGAQESQAASLVDPNITSGPKVDAG